MYKILIFNDYDVLLNFLLRIPMLVALNIKVPWIPTNPQNKLFSNSLTGYT